MKKQAKAEETEAVRAEEMELNLQPSERPAAKKRRRRPAGKRVVAAEESEQAALDNSEEWVTQEQMHGLHENRLYGKTYWQAMMKQEPGLFRNRKITMRNLDEFWRRNPNFKRRDSE